MRNENIVNHLPIDTTNKTPSIECVDLLRAMHLNYCCLVNLSSELSLFKFIKIGPPTCKKRRLFFQITKDSTKKSHEYYNNIIKYLDNSEGDKILQCGYEYLLNWYRNR